MLRTLLADPTPGVQGSAALALARSARRGSAPLLVSAYDAALAADARSVSAGAARDARPCRDLELAPKPRKGCSPRRRRIPMPACASSRSPPPVAP